MRLRRYCRWSNLLLGLIAAVGIARVSVTRTEAACVAPPSGLAAWWSGNGNTLDFAGAHPGTMANQAYFAPGQAGLGFALTGANAYVYVPPSPAWNLGTNAFSIELWANFNATGDRVLVASDAGGGSNNKWLFWTTGGKLQFHINDITGNVSNIGTGSFTPTLGQWYHLGLTRSGSNFVFYVNGAPLVTNSVDRVIPDAGAPLTIGQAEGGYFFNGILDEVSIYNKALTGAEVQSVFQAGGAGKCGATTSGGAVPYATDFEAPIGQEWSSTVASTESTAVFSRFTGRFSNEAQTLVLTNLVPGQAYTVGFDFYALDTWDGTSGGDAFNVVVNGNSVFHETFSNYNGNPPSSPQSYPGDPDEGRADFGFTQGYVDAIYRNIEVPFVASNSVVAVAFYGQNLQNLDDESWGLDNVSVRLSSSLPGTVIRTTTLPAAGSTVSTPIDVFSVSASHPLQAASAGATGSWSLRSAGPDGTLGNADDVTIPLTISLPGPGGRSVSFAVANVPLQPAKYRFQSLAGLQGTNNVAVPTFTRDFTIA
ncbi:MAG TPA: LamG domain-containing protein, partial [Candidatus Limnocylindria bacterium]|nr:LamG domain-containing protein [Candidatus Limnocylindria bacterium]